MTCSSVGLGGLPGEFLVLAKLTKATGVANAPRPACAQHAATQHQLFPPAAGCGQAGEACHATLPLHRATDRAVALLCTSYLLRGGLGDQL